MEKLRCKLGKYVRLLCRIYVKLEKKRDELASVPYVECVPPSDDVDGARRFLYLQWAAMQSKDKGNDVKKG